MASSDRLYAFPRRYRLLHSSEFEHLYQRGRRVTTKYFVLYGRARVGSPARLGLTVSRKIGNAVQRNRVKRILRELFRRYRPSLFKTPYDVVIHARRGIAVVPYRILEDAFCQAVAQLETEGPRKSQAP